MSRKPRPGILDIAPYVGGEAKLAGQKRVIRLASNESPLGPRPRPSRAYRALAGEIAPLSRRRREAAARRASAGHHRLDADASSAAPARTS